MKAFWVAVLISAIPVVAQDVGSKLVTPDQARKQIFNNERVTAYAQEIPSGRSFATKNTRDTISVSINDEGKGVELRPAGTSVRIKNSGKAALRSVEVQFAEPIGPRQSPTAKRAHYCNDEDKKACVTENFLFCTPKLCVEEVTMAPGARSTRHSHDTEHMLVAITDYSLVDDVSGKGLMNRTVKSGGVEYLPAGITHVLTNAGKSEVRLVAIIFR
jgi:quercetin dioxygenase-like cupin family protein